MHGGAECGIISIAPPWVLGVLGVLSAWRLVHVRGVFVSVGRAVSWGAFLKSYSRLSASSHKALRVLHIESSAGEMLQRKVSNIHSGDSVISCVAMQIICISDDASHRRVDSSLRRSPIGFRAPSFICMSLFLLVVDLRRSLLRRVQDLPAVNLRQGDLYGLVPLLEIITGVRVQFRPKIVNHRLSPGPRPAAGRPGA